MDAGARYIHRPLEQSKLDHAGGEEHDLATFLNFREGLETSPAGCGRVNSCHGTSGCDAYALSHTSSYLKYIKDWQAKCVPNRGPS
eukprot:scaffold8095_cov753-Prasinococcus_capsulatus_cf.AAC.1